MKNPKEKVYILGKISGMEAEAAILFQKAEDFLTENGYEPVNPMKLPHNHDKKWISYMKECIPALCQCDYILPMFNAKDSRGSKLEMTIAYQLKIPALQLYITSDETKALFVPTKNNFTL